MTYQPYLISNYATGYDRELQPWLLPDDAFTELTDGYVYKGVLNKRDGYTGYATGSNSTYCESRMVHTVAAAVMAGAIDSVNATYTLTATTPVRRGTFVVTGTTPAQSLTDDGVGAFTGDGTGTIDYTTGAVTVILTTAPTAGTVTATYDYHQGLPVMGIMSYYPTNNVRQMVVVDTKYVNSYDPSTDTLIDISPAAAYLGGNSDFFGWVNYASATFAQRLLFCNRVNGDVVQQWDGATVIPYVTDLGFTLNARQMFNFSGRLVLFQTIEAGTTFSKRIRISGIGANSDSFLNTSPGAGFIDIDDDTQFFGAIQNRNDLLVFTEGSTWVLRFTGNDVTPFSLQRIDSTRGSSAAFSVISYLNRTMAASKRGLILCDGYEVERMDTNIPEFTFNQVNNNYFDRCFSAFLDEDRDVYLMYPSVNTVRPPLVAANASDEILVTNFEEDNYCIYNIPLSCMGNFQETITVLWSDLTAAKGYPNWETLAAKYNNWNAFPFTIGSPLSIGGGHKGEIWTLNSTEGVDNPHRIRAITIVTTTSIQVTTDWNNYNVGDYVYFSGVGGMTEINNKQGSIESVDTDYNIFTVEFDEKVGEITNAYTSGGTTSRCIPMVATSKKLNPWVNMDKKVRCGWIYFYVSIAKTLLKHPVKDADDVETQEPSNAVLKVDVITNDNEYPNFSETKFKYEINCTNLTDRKGSKKWVKIWINQVGQFLQFRMHNNQAGANIQVHAMMCGFQPVGELI